MERYSYRLLDTKRGATAGLGPDDLQPGERLVTLHLADRLHGAPSLLLSFAERASPFTSSIATRRCHGRQRSLVAQVRLQHARDYRAYLDRHGRFQEPA